MKVERIKHKFIIFIKFLTIELYYPYIVYNNSDMGIIANSVIIFKPKNRYRMKYYHFAMSLRFLGFGVGFAWKHCDNPYWVEYNDIR